MDEFTARRIAAMLRDLTAPELAGWSRRLTDRSGDGSAWAEVVALVDAEVARRQV